MKQGSIFKIIFRIVGIVILIQGIRMMTEGVLNYVEQHEQADWITITAEVTDVSSRVRSSRTKNKPSDTVYDITYQYEVDGTIYTDEIANRPQIHMVGDDIKIKYDPKSPEKSTTTLSPSISDMIVFLVFGAIFAILGFFLSGLYALLRRLLRRGKPEEEEELPPEEYVDSQKRKKVPESSATTFIRRIIQIAAFLGVVFLSTKFFPGTQQIGVEQFKNIVEAEGYVTTDTTEQLRQDWRVGSMLKESVSFDNGMIRMDFCAMDSVNSAGNLYNGMTLPLEDGEKQELSGIVHELSSVENETLYVAKVRIRNTIIYVAATTDHKAEVVELLEKLGYWKE